MTNIAIERSTMFHGKIHYFDWAMFYVANCWHNQAGYHVLHADHADSTRCDQRNEMRSWALFWRQFIMKSLLHLETPWNILKHLETAWNSLEHLGTSWILVAPRHCTQVKWRAQKNMPNPRCTDGSGCANATFMQSPQPNCSYNVYGSRS